MNSAKIVYRVVPEVKKVRVELREVKDNIKALKTSMDTMGRGKMRDSNCEGRRLFESFRRD